MFEPTSRYHRISTTTLTITERDGSARQVVYARRRFVPQPGGNADIEHTVVQGERVDHIADTYLGDPTQFYLLCDENRALHPDELTAEIGRALRIPSPSF